MGYTVRQVARLSGVTIRTLHHYDAAGLVRPRRTASGYRSYEREDLERLQQVLFFKELGLGLLAIKAILDEPGFDREKALHEHRRLLILRKERLERLIGAVDGTVEAMKEGYEMDERSLFDGFDPSEYEDEVRRRWGHTEAYRESKARTRGYTKADWKAVAKEQTDLLKGIAGLSDRRPDDAGVLEAVGQMHRFINERFYSCSLDMFRSLGDLAVDDERFKATYEGIRPGFSAFMHAAVSAYCDRKGQRV